MHISFIAIDTTTVTLNPYFGIGVCIAVINFRVGVQRTEVVT